VPIPAVATDIASMKSKVLMADLLVLQCRFMTNAEAAILFSSEARNISTPVVAAEEHEGSAPRRRFKFRRGEAR
jgi:hypothetical protein